MHYFAELLSHRADYAGHGVRLCGIEAVQLQESLQEEDWRDIT